MMLSRSKTYLVLAPAAALLVSVAALPANAQNFNRSTRNFIRAQQATGGMRGFAPRGWSGATYGNRGFYGSPGPGFGWTGQPNFYGGRPGWGWRSDGFYGGRNLTGTVPYSTRGSYMAPYGPTWRGTVDRGWGGTTANVPTTPSQTQLYPPEGQSADQYQGDALSQQVATTEVTLVNPRESQRTVNYRINGRSFSMPPGYTQRLPAGRSWVIEFERGTTAGSAQYPLLDGTYTFSVTDRGLELFHSAGAAASDRSRALEQPGQGRDDLNLDPNRSRLDQSQDRLDPNRSRLDPNRDSLEQGRDRLNQGQNRLDQELDRPGQTPGRTSPSPGTDRGNQTPGRQPR
jgi:hypothetical protein